MHNYKKYQTMEATHKHVTLMLPTVHVPVCVVERKKKRKKVRFKYLTSENTAEEQHKTLLSFDTCKRKF